jgi:DNA modification methylase
MLLNTNCFDALANLPQGSVDLIFADPPYNLQLQQELWRPNLTLVDAVNDHWDQFGSSAQESFAAYDRFTREWLKVAQRVLTDRGTIWISGTYHNIFRVGMHLQDLGFWILNTVTWHKTNAMPNFRGTRLKNDVEFVIWAQKKQGGSYTFNNHLMKRYNGDKQLGSVWQIPACGGAERLKDVNGNKLHPTQKPEALLERIIVASSQPGDLVLDPFMGTGTTPAVAKRLHRRYIGIELDPTYFAVACQRVEQTMPLPDDDPLVNVPSRHRRVPLRALIEAGLMTPGMSLFLDDPECEATLLEDGRLQAGDLVGSIHKLGALLKGTPSCNGWKHWRYRDESGNLSPLDHRRQQWIAAQ